MNSINVITPYKKNNLWQFNDLSRNLIGEPFVGETNLIIDQMINDSLYVDKNDVVSIYFADFDFPGAEFVVTRFKYENNGAWYKWGSAPGALKGWLCPATLKYFSDFPKKIFISLFTNNKK